MIKDRFVSLVLLLVWWFPYITVVNTSSYEIKLSIVSARIYVQVLYSYKAKSE